MRRLTSWLWLLGTVGLLGTAPAQKQQEVSLVGIRLFNHVKQVLAKYGNPQQIRAVAVQAQRMQLFAGQQEGGGGGRMGPGGGGLPGPAGPPGFGPSGGGPMGGPMGGEEAQYGTEYETLYVFRIKGGYTYTFLVNKDGRVIQISAYGNKPSPQVRTRRGITLGATYKQVIQLYDYPTEHEYIGDTYVIRYHKLGVAFQLDARTHKVIAIMVAAGMPRAGAAGAGMAAGGVGGAQMGGGFMGKEAGGGGGGAAAATAF